MRNAKILARVAIAAVLLASLFTLAAPPKPASAHPMGNFTINHYSALTVDKDGVDVLYVVDMAEIPTYQELQTIRDVASTDLTTAERDAYTSKKAAELMPNLSLSINGQPATLTLVDKPALSFPPGAGGLPTLRLEFRLRAAETAQNGSLEYHDNNYEERIGWKEIIAVPGAGMSFQNASVPSTDLSDQLHKYPPDLINTPPRVTVATLLFSPATGAETAAALPSAAAPSSDSMWGSLGWVKQQTDIISDIMKQKDMPLGALLTALLIAFSIGAAHALSPGHGKTVVAAYLVGSRGTAWHAVLLGLTVTLSHTMGVFALGFVVLYLANFILPETLYPYLSFLSGMLLVVMGVSLFVQRYRSWRRAKVARLSIAEADIQLDLAAGNSHGQDGHTHDGHTHDSHSHGGGHGEHTHAHPHPHAPQEMQGPEHSHDGHEDPSVPHKHGMLGRAHTHIPAGNQKVTLGNLLVLGITGGIIPCPSALVVLLVGVASGQIALGLTLIVAFSVGLAMVLVAIGLLMVYSRNLLNRVKLRNGPFTAIFSRLPMASALAVSGLGVVIAMGAFNLR